MEDGSGAPLDGGGWKDGKGVRGEGGGECGAAVVVFLSGNGWGDCEERSQYGERGEVPKLEIIQEYSPHKKEQGRDKRDIRSPGARM